jgi:hypothetical protein
VAKETDQKKNPANSVFALSRSSRCHGCDLKLVVDDIVKLNTKSNDETEAFCRQCAGLSELEVLRSGNAQVTRLAKKYSKNNYVILKWSELWKTYERQGLLVEPDALKRAREEAGKK